MSDHSTSNKSDRQAKLERVLADYLHAVEKGQPFDRQALIAAHPDLSDDLQSFFRNRDSMDRLAEPLKAAIDAPTLLSATDAGPSQPGMTVRYFGDYELLDEIARGGMGVVFKARQVNLNRVVALKMILAGQLANEADVKRFYAEAEAAAKLDHPGIVPIFEIGQHEGQHYFSMAFIECESLAKKAIDGPMPPREAAEMVKKVAEAVEYAHQKGIIHRDLKPANVLLDANGQPKVTDFGLAKQMQADSGLTGSGQILGTPSYMPPEQAAGRLDQVGPQSDVYALGAILYCLLTGRPPFQAASPMDTLRQVLEQEPVSVRLLNPQVPLDLETIAVKCLEKESVRRYARAAELADELGRFLRGEPILARPVGTIERTWRWCKRNRQVAGLLATVACLLLVGIARTSWLARVANLNAKVARENARDAAHERDRANDMSQAALHEKEIAEKQRQLAVEQQAIAERERDVASRNLYVANIHLARQAWESSEITHLQELLRRSEPQQGQHDLRGWEWEFLRAQSRSVVSLSGHALEISALAWSPDGRRLASSGAPSSAEFGELKIWDTETGRELFSLENRAEFGISTIAWSPDGKRLVSGGGRIGGFQNRLPGELKIWDTESGQEVLKLTGHLGMVNSAAFSPDGRRLASAGGEFGPPGQAKVWDVESGREVLDLQGHINQVNSISWSPDGRRLATATANGMVRVFDAETGMAQHMMQTALACYATIWSPNGQKLATHSADQMIRIWDASTGAVLSEIATTARASRTFLVGFEWFTDSEHLSWIDARGTITTWDLATNKSVETTVSHMHNVHAAKWSPDHERLALAGSDQTIKISDDTAVPDALAIEGAGVVALSPDGKRLATAMSDVRIWDAVSGRPTQVWSWPPNWVVMAVAWSPDGKRMISSSVQSFPGGIKMWDVEAEKELHVWQGHIGPPNAVAWSPDGKRLATCAMDKLVKVWDADAPETEILKLEGHDASVLSVAWHPHANRLASAGAEGLVKLWDLADANKTMTMSGHAGMVRSVAWSAGGERLASAGVDGIKIWDSQSGELLGSLRGHSDMVLSVAWQPESDPDRQRLASVSLDGTLKLWDLESGQEVLTLRNKVPFLSVTWTPDGKQLIAGSADGARIWNAGKQRSRSELRVAQVQQSAWAIVPSRHHSVDVYRHAVKMLENCGPDAEADPVFLMTLGVARFRAGNFQAAAKTLETADKLARQTREGRPQPGCLAVLAMAHLKLGHLEDALTQLRELNPSRRKSPASLDAALNELVLEAAWTVTDGACRWTTLRPSGVRSQGGATLAAQPDDSILVTGENPANDTYTIECPTESRTISALRLDVLRDERLPGGGPGRLPNGTFILSGIEASILDQTNGNEVRKITLMGAIADYTQPGHDAASVIDGTAKTGWAIWRGEAPLTDGGLILLLQEPVRIAQGAKLQITLRHASLWKDGNLGRFRLSVTPSEGWWYSTGAESK